MEIHLLKFFLEGLSLEGAERGKLENKGVITAWSLVQQEKRFEVNVMVPSHLEHLLGAIKLKPIRSQTGANVEARYLGVDSSRLDRGGKFIFNRPIDGFAVEIDQERWEFAIREKNQAVKLK